MFISTRVYVQVYFSVDPPLPRGAGPSSSFFSSEFSVVGAGISTGF